MTYCTNCGTQINDDVNFCPSCGATASGHGDTAQSKRSGNAAKTAATIAGTAVGVSLLSRMARRRHRPPMPPHGGMHRGGIPPHGRRGPMGGPGRGSFR